MCLFLYNNILGMLVKFSKHYRDDLFTPNDFLKVLISLLIVTEVRSGEYLVPCVLDVSDIYPSPALSTGSMRSSFVLHFSKKSPIIGIYCCTISYLMSEAGWKLLTEGGEVVQVARNSITFEMPRKGLAGKLTFLDPLSSYLEIIVEFPVTIAVEHRAMLYHEIRKTFFFSYTSLFSSDECVRRSLVQYVTLLLRNRTIDIHNHSITMLKLDEFNRILTVHYSYTSLFSSDECVRRSLVQ